jgi:hypothetical protein
VIAITEYCTRWSQYECQDCSIEVRCHHVYILQFGLAARRPAATTVKLRRDQAMTARTSIATHRWRELYRAALLEKDRQKLASRIEEAEKALLTRNEELIASGQDYDEAHAIDDALYSLRALNNCLKLNTRDSEAA